MANKVLIKQFRNKAKKPVAGLTPEHAIYDANGVRLDSKLGNVNLQEFRDLQKQGTDAIKSQEAQSLQALENREAEILAKSDAIEISFDNIGTAISGTNVQDAIEETYKKVTELETQTNSFKGEVMGASIGRLSPINTINGFYIKGSYWDDSIGEKVANADADIRVYKVTRGKSYHIDTEASFGGGVASVCLFKDSDCNTFVSMIKDTNSSTHIIIDYVATDNGYIGMTSTRDDDYCEGEIVGSLDTLETEDKASIIGAINSTQKSVDSIYSNYANKLTPQKVIPNKYVGGPAVGIGKLVDNSSSNVYVFKVEKDNEYRIITQAGFGGGVVSACLYKDVNCTSLIKMIADTSETTLLNVSKKVEEDCFLAFSSIDSNTCSCYIYLKYIQSTSIIDKRKYILPTLFNGYITNGNAVIQPQYSGWYIASFEVDTIKKYHIEGHFIGHPTMQIGFFTDDTLGVCVKTIELENGKYSLDLNVPVNATILAITWMSVDVPYYPRCWELNKAIGTKKEKMLVTWGDSLTFSMDEISIANSIQDRLSEYMPDYRIVNAGVGGDPTGTMNGRQNGMYLKNAITLPASANDKVVVSLEDFMGDNATPLQQPSMDETVNPCYINDIECELSVVGGGDDAIYYLQRKENGRAIGFPVGTLITTNAMKNYNSSDIIILGIGTNNGFESAEELGKKIIDTYDMVKSTTGAKVLFWSTHQLGWNSGTDEEQLSNLKTIEAILRKHIGCNYVNWREYACTNAIYDAGLTPTSKDLEQMQKGFIPPQMLKDQIHLTRVGYRILADYLYRRIKILGWLN